MNAINDQLNRDTEYNLSNPSKLVSHALKICEKLGEKWDLGDFKQKIQMQNLICPDGIFFDPQTNDYRTS